MGNVEFLQWPFNALCKSAKRPTPAVSHGHHAEHKTLRANELENNYYLPASLAGLLSND